MTTEVLYIAGAGRSGSTFLSLMLSQHARAWNIGQVRDLMDAVDQGAPCACRVDVPECPYWGAVVARLRKAHGGDVLEALRRGVAGFSEATTARPGWDRAPIRARLSKEHGTFLTLWGALYAACAQEAEGRMLIDSSKSVDLAFALMLTPGVRVRILNLVRDPRAVAVSWAKVLKNPQVLKRRTRNWVGRQKRLQLLQEVAPDNFMMVRYEDLTADPQGWMARIQGFAGLAPDLSLFTGPDSAAISWDRAHLFPPANAAVLAARAAQITIKPASSWRDPKHAELHVMAEEVTFPFAETLGYERGLYKSE